MTPIGAGGFSNPAAWLAEASGVTAGEANAALHTAFGLDGCPETKEAMLAGELSLCQAGEIARTEAAVPGSEAAMLDLAARSAVSALRDEGRRLAARDGDDAEEAHRRRRRERYLRHWQDDEGMVHLAAAWPAETGVAVVSRVDAEVDRLVRKARRHADGGEAEPVERWAADALAGLVVGAASGRARRADVVVVCDIVAFQRGHAEPGEVCHIVDGAPVPVSVARELAAAGFIKAVLHNGKRIEWVAHFGRYLSSELRTALADRARPSSCCES